MCLNGQHIVIIIIIFCRNTNKAVHFSLKFGKKYALLNGDMMDDLCIWIGDMRDRYHEEGRAVFAK